MSRVPRWKRPVTRAPMPTPAKARRVVSRLTSGFEITAKEVHLVRAPRHQMGGKGGPPPTIIICMMLVGNCAVDWSLEPVQADREDLAAGGARNPGRQGADSVLS
eukprot:5552428-Alexandrium_andersonii.AAC.1